MEGIKRCPKWWINEKSKKWNAQRKTEISVQML